MDEFIIKSDTNVLQYEEKSVAEHIINRLSKDSNEICFIDCSLDRKWTKQQVLDSSLNLAYYLSHDLNLRKGEVVCVGANNSDIHAITFCGVLAAGAVYTSFQEDRTEYEINGILTKVKPSVIICTNKNYETISELSKSSTYIKKIVIIDRQSKSQTKSDEITVEEIFGRSRDPEYKLPIKTGLNDLATYVMTSGSTGQPKVITRTNETQLAMIACLQHKECYGLNPNDTHLATGFCHISGQMFLMAAISGGAKLAIIRDEENSQDFFKMIDENLVSSSFLTAVRLNFLVKNYHTFNENYLSCLKVIMTGGAPMSENTYKGICKEMKHVTLRNCFGMSEIGWATIVPHSHSRNITNCLTVGKVVPGVELKVIDENGVSLPPNKSGEICIRSRQITPGYLDNPEENAKLFTNDGFLRSGDIAYYDENGFFYIVGRIKDMIIVGSTNVLPVELERILETHSDVENASVIGVKHDVFNEVPLAFVTLARGSTVSEQTLIDYVNSRVSDLKTLRGGLIILDSFPMTPFKKVNKPELKKLILK